MVSIVSPCIAVLSLLDTPSRELIPKPLSFKKFLTFIASDVIPFSVLVVFKSLNGLSALTFPF